jgi:hypothetical protein
MAKTPTTQSSISIDPLKRGRVTVKLIGETPFYFNAMSSKAKRDLLIGGGRKTAAEKREIKHDPEVEFRSSVYTMQDGPTLLGFPAPGVKNAMATAALETAGVKKTSVQRLVFLPQERVRMWGKPYLKMDVVRSADMNKTPDVRTRAFLKRWAVEVDLAFVTPALAVADIVALLANAGMMSGIGDFRQEKGKGSYGTFRVLADDDKEGQALFKELVENEGRECQVAAMENPEAADEDTRELWAMLRQERMRRQAS